MRLMTCTLRPNSRGLAQLDPIRWREPSSTGGTRRSTDSDCMIRHSQPADAYVAQ